MKQCGWLKDHHPEMPRVPQSFLSELKRLDTALTIKWNALRHRYVIVDNTSNRIVRTVEGQGGDYLPLDRRTILGLLEQDVTRYGHGRQQDYFAHFDAEAKASKEKNDRQFQTNVHDALTEAKPQLAGNTMVSKP